MNKSTFTRTLLLLTLAVVMLGALAWLLSSGHHEVWHDGSLLMFDEDLSDSFIGWAIAIPILILAAVFTVIVLAGTGVLVAGVMMMVVVIGLLALVFAVVVAVLPLLVFLAVPVLAIVGLVNLLSRRARVPV